MALRCWLAAWPRTDTGKAIRAVAKEKQGARLVGIDVEHVYAVTFGIGTACLARRGLPADADLSTSTRRSGNAFVLVAFTIVVLGGMGCFAGALLGGLLIGVVESAGRAVSRRVSLGQIGIFADLHPRAAVPARPACSERAA